MPELRLPAYDKPYVKVGKQKLTFLDDPPFHLTEQGFRCRTGEEWETWLRAVMTDDTRTKYDGIVQTNGGCPWGIRRMRDIGIALLSEWLPHLTINPDPDDGADGTVDPLGKSGGSDT